MLFPSRMTNRAEEMLASKWMNRMLLLCSCIVVAILFGVWALLHPEDEWRNFAVFLAVGLVLFASLLTYQLERLNAHRERYLAKFEQRAPKGGPSPQAATLNALWQKHPGLKWFYLAELHRRIGSLLSMLAVFSGACSLWLWLTGTRSPMVWLLFLLTAVLALGARMMMQDYRTGMRLFLKTRFPEDAGAVDRWPRPPRWP